MDITNYSWSKSLVFKLLVVAGMMGFNVKPLSAQSANTRNPELVEIRHSDGSPTGKFKQKKKWQFILMWSRKNERRDDFSDDEER